MSATFGLFYAVAASFLVGVWISAMLVAVGWWFGITSISVGMFVQVAVLAGLCTLLLAEVVAGTRGS